MTSSGIKRGLAVSAISAMALAGAPLLATSAFADSLPSYSGATTLQSLSAANVSIKNDGVNTTVSLVATAPSTVTQVQFSVTNGATTTNIGTPVTRDSDGTFSYEWTPDVALNNLTVGVNAQGENSSGTAVGALSTSSVKVDPTANTVELASGAAASSDIGLFLQPYAASGHTAVLGVVNGTSSDLTGNVTVQSLLPTGGGAAATAVSPAAAVGATSRPFTGVVNFGSSYHFDASGANQVLVGASVGGNVGSDAQGYNIYDAVPRSISAVPTTSNVPTGVKSDVVVTVLDALSKPVVGVQIYKQGQGGASDTLIGYTNASGQVTDSAESAGSYSYFANTTNNVAYESGVDLLSSAAVISTYAPVASHVLFTSTNGSAFDSTEYTSADDLSIQVTDQNNVGLAGQNFFYSWTYTPFNPTATDVAKTFDEGHVTTGANGKVDLMPVNSPASLGGTYVLNGYVNLDNLPGQGSGDLPIAPQTIEVGQSKVVWNDVSPAQRQAGTTQTFAGKLELPDGTGLNGRSLNLAFADAGAGDASIAAQASQPTGTVRSSGTAASTTTGTGGSFSVAVTDPAAVAPATQTEEHGDTLTATGTAAPGVGTDATAQLSVDFLNGVAPLSITATPVTDLLNGEATPGRPVTFKVHVSNGPAGTGTALANQSVTLTTDHGFFTPAAQTAAALTPASTPAAGATYGVWKNLGTSTQVTTDASGNAWVTVAIGADTGFNDDFAVTSTIGATDGTLVVPSVQTVAWSSEDALNSGAVQVKLAAAADQDPNAVAALPNAQAGRGRTVAFDLYTTDQFGNLTDGSAVVSDGTSAARVNGGTSAVTLTGETTSDAPAITLDSDVAASQTLHAEWVGTAATYAGSPLAESVAPATLDADSATTIAWYTVDLAASKIGISVVGGNAHKVGDTVKVTYSAVDQHGVPIEDIDTAWFRAGPDTLQNGGQDFSGDPSTNAAGQSLYIFQGTRAGSAKVNVVARDDDNGGALLGDLGDRSVSIAFAAPPVAIHPTIKLSNNRVGNDVVTVTSHTTADRGAVVKIMSGGKVVASGHLNPAGNATFTVKDPNKQTKRSYRAVISATAHSKAGSTGTAAIK